MKKEKFSYTRISCYQTCRWQYYLKYVKKFKVERTDNTKLANKGIAFHEIAEKYKSTDTIDDLTAAMRARATELSVDPDEYDYREAAIRLRWFMDDFVGKKDVKLERESWVNGELAGVPFCGALDVRLTPKKKDGAEHYYIVDFKSGKKADTESYRSQLALYTHLWGAELGFDFDETIERVHAYAFFPLAVVPRASTLSDEERAMESLKKIHFTIDQLMAYVAQYEDTVAKIKAEDWSRIDEKSADISFVCSFCQFAGIPKGFHPVVHCARTYDNGVKAPRSIKIGLDAR